MYSETMTPKPSRQSRPSLSSIPGFRTDDTLRSTSRTSLGQHAVPQGTSASSSSHKRGHGRSGSVAASFVSSLLPKRSVEKRRASSSSFLYEPDVQPLQLKGGSTGPRHPQSLGGSRQVSGVTMAYGASTITGLGLEGSHPSSNYQDSERGSLRGSKSLAKLKSFNMRPTFSRGWSETLMHGKDANAYTARGGIDQSPAIRGATGSKSMSRTSSFISFIGQRSDRSVSRQSNTSIDETQTSYLPLAFTQSGLHACTHIDPPDIVTFENTAQPMIMPDSLARTLRKSRYTPSYEALKWSASSSSNSTDSSEGTTSYVPSVVVQRILPPEHMIDAFDRLRIVDPSGRARDELGATGKSPLLSEGYSVPPSPAMTPTSPCWKTDTSPHLDKSIEWGSRQPLRKIASRDGHDQINLLDSLHSLPAPPRKPKRRPQTASGCEFGPRQDSSATRSLSSPLSDISNRTRHGNMDISRKARPATASSHATLNSSFLLPLQHRPQSATFSRDPSPVIR